jgi:hypothetical protein
MTSTSSSSSSVDWRVLRLPNATPLSPGQLSQQRCPFFLEPENCNSVPAVYKMNLHFLVMGQEGAPWTGYYTNFYGVKLAVLNFLGIWFKIQRHEGSFEAFQVACEALNLQNHPLPGTSISLLMTMSERLPTT